MCTNKRTVYTKPLTLEWISKSLHPGGHAGVLLAEALHARPTITRERERQTPRPNNTRGEPASTEQETHKPRITHAWSAKPATHGFRHGKHGSDFPVASSDSTLRVLVCCDAPAQAGARRGRDHGANSFVGECAPTSEVKACETGGCSNGGQLATARPWREESAMSHEDVTEATTHAKGLENVGVRKCHGNHEANAALHTILEESRVVPVVSLVVLGVNRGINEAHGEKTVLLNATRHARLDSLFLLLLQSFSSPARCCISVSVALWPRVLRSSWPG